MFCAVLTVVHCAYCGKFVRVVAVCTICSHSEKMFFHVTPEEPIPESKFRYALNYGCFEKFHTKDGYNESYYQFTRTSQTNGKKYCPPAWIQLQDEVGSFLCVCIDLFASSHGHTLGRFGVR